MNEYFWLSLMLAASILVIWDGWDDLRKEKARRQRVADQRAGVTEATGPEELK
jgi:hypothetical protein